MVRITIRYESKKLKCEEKKNISDCEKNYRWGRCCWVLRTELDSDKLIYIVYFLKSMEIWCGVTVIDEI